MKFYKGSELSFLDFRSSYRASNLLQWQSLQQNNSKVIQGVMHSKILQRREAHMAVLITTPGSTTKHCCWDQQQCSTTYGWTRGKKSTWKAREYNCWDLHACLMKPHTCWKPIDLTYVTDTHYNIGSLQILKLMLYVLCWAVMLY